MLTPLRRLQVLITCGLVVMLAAPASYAQVTYQFDLPAQALTESLLAIARQTGSNILFESKDLEGITAPALHAQLTTAEAVERVLVGTKLEAQQTTPTTVVVQPLGRAASAINKREERQRPLVLARAQTGSQTREQAASRGEESTPAPATEAAPALEEVIVTAERREENLQNVPISMTVFSGDFIKDNFSDPYEIANLVPNLQLDNFSGITAPTITIRGLGTQQNQFGPTAATTVLVYHDNIVSDTGFVSSLPQWDLDRIEALRGPQGTLYGRNAVGGLVRYVSAAPTEEFEGYGQFTLGEFDARRFEGAVSGPVTENVKARVSALSYERGGDVTNPLLDVEQGEQSWWGVKGIVDWQITDSFDARVIGQYVEADTDILFFNAVEGSRLAPNVRAFQAAMGHDPDLSRNSNYEQRQSSLADPFETFKVSLTELDLNYDFGAVMLTAIGSYVDGENRANDELYGYPIPAVDQLLLMEQKQWSAELRLTSQSDHALKWVAGVYHQRSESSQNSLVDVSGLQRDMDGDGLTRHNRNSPEDDLDGLFPSVRASNVFLDQGRVGQELETSALFLHTTYDWNDRLRTTHAVRFTREAQDGTFARASSFEFPVSPGVIPGARAQHDDFVTFANLTHAQQRQQAVSIIADPNVLDANGNIVPTALNASWEEPTWRFAADYRLTDDAMIYASISKGFRGGKLVSQVAGTEVVDPETSTVYEVGAKSQSFGNRLQVNVSAFYNDHRDFQTRQLVFDPNNALSGFVTLWDNLPKLEIYGGEIEIQAVPLRNLLVLLNLGITESSITKVLPGNEALLGNELPFAEDLSVGGLMRYDIPAAIGKLSPQVSWSYRGKFWSLQDNNDITGRLGGFWTVDLRLGYESTDGKLYGSLNLKNLFDEVQPIMNTIANASVGTTFSSINARRSWGVTAGYRF